MNPSKLRRSIAHEAARLLYLHEESEYFRAKQKASRRLCQGWVKPADLPSNAEIRDVVQSFARMHEGPDRLDTLREMRMTALRVMRLTSKFHPKLIGSVLTGHVRRGSDIDIHVFSDSIEAVAACFDDERIPYEIERKQHPKYHPEGDVLYPSLQVFDLACDSMPYDEEFLLAALLHDIGKGIDSSAHVDSGLEALEGLITRRTHWLISNHMEAHRIFDGTIGSRAHRRLRENESYEDLLLLSECDRGGRVPGAVTTELEEAIDYIRSLGDENWSRDL